MAGEPLTLVEIRTATSASSRHEFVINDQAAHRLEENLKKTQKSKVAVLSVVGEFRGGKSFLLNLMLRYLRHLSSTSQMQHPDDGEPESKRQRIGGWLVPDNEAVIGNDFVSDFGKDTVTKGIVVWSEPFIIQDIALVLMDTQGCWDELLKSEASASLFGLSALVSSKLVYNIKHPLSEANVGDILVHFVRIMREATQEGDKELEPAVMARQKALPSLTVLVRDTPLCEPEHTFGDCKENMKDVLRKFIPEKPDEGSPAEFLRDSCQDVTCIGLPFPGVPVTRRNWSRKVKEIDEHFRQRVDEYFQELFSPEAMLPKQLFGQSVTCNTFVSVMTDCVNTLRNASAEVQPLIRLYLNENVNKAKEACVEAFHEKTRNLLGQNRDGLRKERFRATCISYVQEVKNHTFSKYLKTQSAELRESVWVEIETGITGDMHMGRVEIENGSLVERAKRRFEQSLVAKFNDMRETHPAGLADDALQEQVDRCKAEVYCEYCTVYGSYDQSADDVSNQPRDEDWNETHGIPSLIQPHIDSLEQWNRMARESARHLDEFLAVAVTSSVLLALDLVSDYACDWWSQTCRAFSYASWWFYMFVALNLIVHSLVICRRLGLQISLNSMVTLFKKSVSDLHTCCVALRSVNTQQLPQEAQRLGTEFVSWAKIHTWPHLVIKVVREVEEEINELRQHHHQE